MSILSNIKESIDKYHGDLNTYRNGFEKFFKQYAGLILGIFSILIAWEVDVYAGCVVAVYSLYICKFIQSSMLRNIGRVCCCVTIFLVILYFLI